MFLILTIYRIALCLLKHRSQQGAPRTLIYAIKMFKFRSIEERQCLIEEIYNELEALLGISDKIKNIEEKSRSSIPDEKIDHSEELADGKLTLTKLSKVQEMNDNEKNIFIQKLISELEEKKQILENSRITLGDLISANSK